MSSTWNEAVEREMFEYAAYAHYLHRRQKRAERGQLGVLDDPEKPHARETLFQRDAKGEYAVIAYQHAWGGWKLARGG